ncbi:MAG: toast rack family protein [Dehalococcoidales bacterium]|nr:toast rack family protein [Dehalococcoidales bacterium]
MPQQKSAPSHTIPVWGVFLLFLGIVLLLQNLKILSWGLWSVLWRFWPIVIITVGLGILLRHRNPWLVSGIILLIFLACLGIAQWQYSTSPASQAGIQNYSAPLNNLTDARVKINFSAGKLTMSSLPSGSLNLVEVESESATGSGIRADFQRQGSEGTLHLETAPVNRQFWDETKWYLNLSRRVPFNLEVNSNVGELNLDLRQLILSELSMDLNAGSCILALPAPTEKTNAYIKANIGNLEVTIPQGAATRIKTTGNLSNLVVDTTRFPKKGDYYVSDGFSTSAQRLEIELNCNIGRVEVK